MIRFFDILFSFFGLLLLSPLFLIIALIIILESKGGVFYKQVRVGKDGKDFELFKFRTMYSGSDKKGLLTVGAADNRITKSGLFLRKYKIDELPQLINVLFGTMSLVGPRPEVRKYTDLYTDEQKKVLSVKPGITDYASVEFSNENELLEKAEDPEAYYIEKIMPHKIDLNFKYINNKSVGQYFAVIFKTLLKIIK